MRTHKASPSCIIIPFLYKAACKTYAPASRSSSRYWSRQPAKAGHGPYDDGLRKQRSGATAIRQGHCHSAVPAWTFHLYPTIRQACEKSFCRFN
ncbi:hypothetical protein [Prevotella denticola]|uniref:hypothetical protein n=1 Tax=Prevotella denticola TaxID=28129 RepID=UPI00241F9A9C|nr:hypothetical protein [Prevotella denticola]